MNKKKVLLDSIQREQTLAEDRHRLLAVALREARANALNEPIKSSEVAIAAELTQSGDASEAPDSRLECPKGHSPMDRIVKGGMQIDRCKICGGLWFDWGELEAMIGHHLGIEIPAYARDIDMKCPRCSGPMCSYNLPEKDTPMEQWSTEIDQCRHCEGVWLDCSELEQIQKSREEKGNKGFLKRFLDKVLG